MAQYIGALGVQKIVIREISRDNSLLNVISRRLWKPLSLSFLGASALLLFYLIFYENETNTNIAGLAILYLLGFVLWNYAEPLAFGLQYMKLSAYLNATSAVVFFFFIMFLPRDYFNLELVLAVFIGFHFLKSLYYLIHLFRIGYFKSGAAVDSNSFSIKKLLRNSWPIFFTTLLTIPLTQLPIIFLSINNSKEEVGFFGVSAKMSLPLSLIANNLITAVYPILTRYSTTDKKVFGNHVSNLISIYFVAGVILTALFSFFSFEIVLIFLGETYLPAVPTLSMQAWIAFFSILNMIIGTVILAADKERLLIKLSIINSLLIGTANYLGSFSGAEITSLYAWIGYIGSLIFNFYFFFKIIELRITNTKITQIVIFVILISFLGYSLSMATVLDRTLFVLVGIISTLYLAKKIFNISASSLLKMIKNYG